MLELTHRDQRTRCAVKCKANIVGFTLIEVLIVISITAILATITIPTMRSIVSSMQISNASNRFYNAYLLGRQLAVARNTPIVLCAVAEIKKLECSGDSDWSKGMLLYADSDGRIHDNEVIRKFSALPKGTILSANGKAANLLFLPDGRVQSNVSRLSNITFSLCSQRFNGEKGRYSRALIINSAGRLRISRGNDNSRC